MFGVSFLEIALVGLVALVVVGPQKLPEMMRTAGEWVGKLRRMTADMRAQTGIDDILREEGIDGVAELRTLLKGERAMAARRAAQTQAYEAYTSKPDPALEFPMEGPDARGALPDDLLADDAPESPPVDESATPKASKPPASKPPAASKPLAPAPHTAAPSPRPSAPPKAKTKPSSDSATARNELGAPSRPAAPPEKRPSGPPKPSVGSTSPPPRISSIPPPPATPRRIPPRAVTHRETPHSKVPPVRPAPLSPKTRPSSPPPPKGSVKSGSKE